jgi:hypothetical protein
MKYLKFFMFPGILGFEDRRIDDRFIAVFRKNPSNDARGVDPVDCHEAGIVGIKHLGKIKKAILAEIRRNPFNPSFSQQFKGSHPGVHETFHTNPYLFRRRLCMPQEKLPFMSILILPQQHRNAAKNQKCEKRDQFSQMEH